MKWTQEAKQDLATIRETYPDVVPWNTSEELRKFVKESPNLRRRSIHSIQQKFGKMYYSGRSGTPKPAAKRVRRKAEPTSQVNPLKAYFCPSCGCSFAIIGE